MGRSQSLLGTVDFGWGIEPAPSWTALCTVNEEFDILAAKALAGEASTEEQARLETLLAQDEDLSREYSELQAAWKTLRRAGPLVQAVEAMPAAMPPERMRYLQEVVRNAHDEVTSSLPERPATPAPSASGQRGRVDDSASLWQWLTGRWRSSLAGLAGVAAVMLLVILGALVLDYRSEKTSSHPNVQAEPVAYVIASVGRVEVQHAGKAIALIGGTALRATDEVLLPTGSDATLITPAGLVRVTGPLTNAAASLVTRVAQTSKPATSGGAGALFQPISRLLSSGLLITTRSSQSIPLYSPIGSTANLTPLILWKNRPGKTYDLIILDEFNSNAEQWRLSSAVSPVEWTKVETWKGRVLAKDGLYRLRLSETGNPLSTCEYTFRTISDIAVQRPTTPDERLLHAAELLLNDPSRLGDALAELLSLPAPLADSELVLRLKLFAFGQLGYQEDFDETRIRIEARK